MTNKITNLTEDDCWVTTDIPPSKNIKMGYFHEYDSRYVTQKTHWRTHMLLKHRFIKQRVTPTCFSPQRAPLQGVRLIHFNSNVKQISYKNVKIQISEQHVTHCAPATYVTCWSLGCILHLVTPLFDLAAEMYLYYSLTWSPLRAKTCRSDPLLIE